MQLSGTRLIALLGVAAALALGLSGCSSAESQEQQLKNQSATNTAAEAAYDKAHPTSAQQLIAQRTQEIQDAGYIPAAQKAQIIARMTAQTQSMYSGAARPHF